jgi:hypothetical protein
VNVKAAAIITFSADWKMQIADNSMIQRANVIPREVQNSHLLSFMNYWISEEMGDFE